VPVANEVLNGWLGGGDMMRVESRLAASCLRYSSRWIFCSFLLCQFTRVGEKVGADSVISEA
jgi:hypothetical protein